jgi:hypothetical protein
MSTEEDDEEEEEEEEEEGKENGTLNNMAIVEHLISVSWCSLPAEHSPRIVVVSSLCACCTAAVSSLRWGYANTCMYSL